MRLAFEHDDSEAGPHGPVETEIQTKARPSESPHPEGARNAKVRGARMLPQRKT